MWGAMGGRDGRAEEGRMGWGLAEEGAGVTAWTAPNRSDKPAGQGGQSATGSLGPDDDQTLPVP